MPAYGLFDDEAQHLTTAQLSLPYFITYLVYPNMEMAVQKGWKLGKVHGEWSQLLDNNNRVCILGPRDHLKSFLCSVAYPLQRAWRESNIPIRIVSSTDNLAMEKLTLLQRIIEWVPELRFLKDTARTWDKHSIVFANGSSIIAHGYDANVRGGHPLLLILDDPIDTKVVYSELLNQRSIERFYSEFLPMARKDTQVLIIGTVQREKDLYGSLDPSIWTVKIYSAILDEEKHLTLCPELWDWDSLQRRKTEIVYVNGDRYWRKEYLNDPKALVGQIFREGWFRYFENSPGDLSVYIGMDPSVGQTVQSDYTAIVAVGISSDNHFYILDVERGRWTLPDRLRILERMCNIHNPRKVGIESVAFSFDTVKQAVETFRYPVLEVKCAGAKAAKMARAEALSVYFRNEKIYMKCKGYDKNQIPLLDKKFIDLRDELIGFPGNFDDQMDALHIAVTMASDEGWKPLRNSTDTFWEGLIKGGSKTQTNPFIKSF